MLSRMGRSTATVTVTTSPASSASDYAKALVAYVPSEGIATFLAVLGLGTSAQAGQTAFWAKVAFVAGLIAIAVVAALRFRWNDQESRQITLSKTIIGIGIASFAFVLYSMATPGGPWEGTFQGATWNAIGGVGALVFGLLFPLLAMRLGLDSNATDLQAIDFPAIGPQKRSDLPLTLSATASSNLPISFISLTPDVCAVADGKVHWVSAGKCRVVAKQPGGGRFAPAPAVTNEFDLAEV